MNDIHRVTTLSDEILVAIEMSRLVEVGTSVAAVVIVLLVLLVDRFVAPSSQSTSAKLNSAERTLTVRR